MSPVNKAKDVQVYPITADTRVLRSRTWDRLKFEIEYALQKGTTANSYLIEGDKIALFDPPGESFTSIFLDALKLRIELETIDQYPQGFIRISPANNYSLLKSCCYISAKNLGRGRSRIKNSDN